MFNKANKPYPKTEESCSDLMRRLMKTFQSDYSKLSTVSNTNSMISHYCNSEQQQQSKEDLATCSPNPKKEFNTCFDSAGKSNMSLMDQLTCTSERAKNLESAQKMVEKTEKDNKEKYPVINMRSLVAENQIKTHLIVDEFMRNINPGVSPVKKLKMA